MRWLAKVLPALILAGSLAGCGAICSSPNPWHAAPWEYGYTPKDKQEEPKP